MKQKTLMLNLVGSDDVETLSNLQKSLDKMIEKDQTIVQIIIMGGQALIIYNVNTSIYDLGLPTEYHPFKGL